MKLIPTSVILIACSGCAALDPLGSPAVSPVTGERDFEARAGIIYRQLQGNASIQGVEGGASGFRFLEIGDGELLGCVTFSDGRFNFESPACRED